MSGGLSLNMLKYCESREKRDFKAFFSLDELHISKLRLNQLSSVPYGNKKKTSEWGHQGKVPSEPLAS